MNDTHERWQRAKAVFQGALDLPPSEREAFVQDACGDDRPLAAQVAALLAADAETETPLESPPLDLAARALGAHEEATEGQRIDRYRLLRPLGHGGMGTVYLAERDDGAYEAHVALKVIRQDVGHPALIRRFHQERQLLARLTHPNIARLLDGGVTPDGLPYLVMEHVEGVPIDHHCVEHAVDIGERIDLFRAVCDAVQAAHRSLVLHCDLKPSNILVTADGTPKLLDFGIARLLDTEVETRHPPVAAPTISRHLMTPAFASPEQVRGETLTTASDVYSLGVVLYLLLADQSPYRTDGEHPHAVEHAVLTAQPEPPSAAIRQVAAGATGTMRQRRRRLRGDLDTIVLKALAKAPEARYDTVQALALDLTRYREGLPVHAQAPSWRYRAGKFLRRNWLAAAAFMAVVTALGLGVLTTNHQAQRAREGQYLAERSLDFVVELFESTHPDNAARKSLLDVLDQAETKIARGFEGQPLVEARLKTTLGEVFRQLAQRDRAEPLLTDALDLRREHLPTDHPDIADTVDELGALWLAYADRRGDARRLLEEAHARRLQMLGDDHVDIALSEHRLGQLALRERDLEAAHAHFERALDIRLRHLGDHARTAETLNSLGVVLRQQGNFDQARQVYEEALRIRRALFGARHWRVASTLGNLAILERNRGNDAVAERHYREALAIHRTTFERHAIIASTSNNLGIVLERQGRYDEASHQHAAAIRMRTALDGDRHPSVGTYKANQARAELGRGERATARRLIDEALDIHQASVGANDPRVAIDLKILATILLASGDAGPAESALRRAMEIERSAFGEDHAAFATTALHLGALLLEHGDCREAEPLLRHSLKIRRARSAGFRSVAVAQPEAVLGQCLLVLGRLDEAERLLHASLPPHEGSARPADRARAEQIRASLTQLAQIRGTGAEKAR